MPPASFVVAVRKPCILSCTSGPGFLQWVENRRARAGIRQEQAGAVRLGDQFGDAQPGIEGLLDQLAQHAARNGVRARMLAGRASGHGRMRAPAGAGLLRRVGHFGVCSPQLSGAPCLWGCAWSSRKNRGPGPSGRQTAASRGSTVSWTSSARAMPSRVDNLGSPVFPRAL